MRDHSVEATIQSGFLQANGMEKYAENAKGAPFSTQDVKNQSQQLQDIKLKQERLKAELHEATQEMDKIEADLKAKLTRNISYFQGSWGKNDKRLEEVAGHALSEHHHHHPKTETQKA